MVNGKLDRRAIPSTFYRSYKTAEESLMPGGGSYRTDDPQQHVHD